ncbi:MAG: hypothetical protein WA728_10230, partial [Xanthobacteraceae bacterium]
TLAFDPVTDSSLFTAHPSPEGQAKLSYVTPLQWLTPDAKLTLSTSGVVQQQRSDCTAVGVDPVTGLCTGQVFGNGFNVTAWAVDGFAMLDVWGFNFVAYGYTGKGVGTEGLFFAGIDQFGEARRSDGGYLQAAYTFGNWFPNGQTLTVGASYGVSRLDSAGTADTAAIDAQCFAFIDTTSPLNNCLVKENKSWIGFARYKLTKWVNLQAEYVSTTAEDQVGQTVHDNAIIAGTTFFW